MITLPHTVTFTGLDEKTNIEEVREFRKEYPACEFGLLFSPDRQGKDKRYPSLAFMEYLGDELGHGLRSKFAAHICGGYSDHLVKEGYCGLEHFLWGPKKFCMTLQVNTSKKIDAEQFRQYSEFYGIEVIVQVKDMTNIQSGSLCYLYDVSGGKGIKPNRWLNPDYDVSMGYAGGINPENVEAVIRELSDLRCSSGFWIDMESGVRDENDNFSLDKCRAVMKVYEKLKKEQRLEELRDLTRLRKIETSNNNEVQ